MNKMCRVGKFLLALSDCFGDEFPATRVASQVYSNSVDKDRADSAFTDYLKQEEATIEARDFVRLSSLQLGTQYPPIALARIFASERGGENRDTLWLFLDPASIKQQVATSAKTLVDDLLTDILAIIPAQAGASTLSPQDAFAQIMAGPALPQLLLSVQNKMSANAHISPAEIVNALVANVQSHFPPPPAAAAPLPTILDK
jgi:hypothetical protein